VATGSVEKGKNVGRPPVNEEIPEDLRPQIEQSSKKSLQADIPFSTCQKIVNVFVETRLHPIKVGVWIAASRTRLIAFIVKIKEAVINEVT
jgi:hypothetical protein